MGMKQALGHGQPSVPFGPGLGNKCIFSRLGTALKPLAVNELTLAGKPDSRTQAQRLEEPGLAQSPQGPHLQKMCTSAGFLNICSGFWHGEWLMRRVWVKQWGQRVKRGHRQPLKSKTVVGPVRQ